MKMIKEKPFFAFTKESGRLLFLLHFCGSRTAAEGGTQGVWGLLLFCSMFSTKIPYPLVLSWINTWVTAPTSFPFWIMGLPLIPWTIPPVSAKSSGSVT